jgi:2-polyprenyl-3-methyl-5-hydroxy-6-metoxy-1,4-benzoquinol methylase
MATVPRMTLDRLRPEVTCRVCDCPQYFEYLPARGYRIVECFECGLRYINPQPSDQELFEFYSGFDQEATWRGDREQRFDVRLRSWIRKFRGRGSVLDVGSSRGNFLLAMRKGGYSVFGVEPSPKNSEFARSANGIPTFTGSVEEFLAAPKWRDFDVISVLNVVEHLRDPRSVLRGLRELMVDGGLLVIAVPDAQLHAFLGRTRKILGFSDPFWMNTKKHPLVGFDPPMHLCSFGPGTITRLIETCGFQKLSVRNAPVMTNDVTWKNRAKAVIHAGSELLYYATAGQVVCGYSTVVLARKV